MVGYEFYVFGTISVIPMLIYLSYTKDSGARMGIVGYKIIKLLRMFNKSKN